MEQNHPRDFQGHPIEPPPLLDVHSLFEVQIKRIHEYKRQLMNAPAPRHALSRDFGKSMFINVSNAPCIFAGKAAAGYETAKDIIRFISAVARKHQP